MASETPTVEKSASAAIASCAAEPAAPSVKAAKRVKKNKTKVKAVVAAVAATQETPDEDAMGNLSLDHPYLSVLYKRLRSHRKKLEKIRNLEQARAQDGKQLNAQQLELMGTKASLEKLVAELEMLREQFVGVFSQELEQKKQEQLKEEAQKQQQEIQEEIEQEETESEEKVEKVEQEQVDEFAHVYELLKTLHLVNLHQAVDKEVPMVLDFFSKVLLGNTRPPAELSYEENLMESLEEAKKYLTGSDKVFACDTTYEGLRAFVDELAKISSGKKEEEQIREEEDIVEELAEEVPEPEVAEEVSDVPVVPAEINTMPEISFFTESQLESEQGDDGAADADQFEVTKSEEEITEVVVSDSHDEPADEIGQHIKVEIEEQVVIEAPPAPESIPAPPLSFAAVAAGVSSERTPSPSASSGSSGQEKKEAGSEDNSPQNKSSRRRGQGRWREKGSNSNSGNKSGNGSPTNGSKPRRPRAPRTNDENSGTQGGKRNASKEDRRPRVERGLRKSGNSSQQQAPPMIAPHA
ncbi:unnamed protein product [Phytophthora lilii]|uniref:Unnamed protein product n=1 Tax=Phytophthora lilii TaxID=2077276 RepID=A0A9W6YDD8_9STRA|nr:unnamed protein product [Phytophthora lilii]